MLALRESLLAERLHYHAMVVHYEERSSRLFSRSLSRFDFMLQQKDREIAELRAKLQSQSPQPLANSPNPSSKSSTDSESVPTGPYIIYRDGHYLDLSEL